MERLLLVLITILITSCSFDNKTGIWKDATNTSVENQSSKSILKENQSSRYEDFITKNKTFNEEKKSKISFNSGVNDPIKIKNWLEQYATSTNNISNFSYSGNKILLLKSRKLSKLSSSRKIIFYKKNLISYDHKGTIFIYSSSLNKKISEYNFYKKKFKSFNKEIDLIINNNILYAADNLGYLYALNLNSNSIIWAKNYGIPFRSNMKFANNQIFLANQDNVIYSIDASSGNKNWEYSTNLTFLKTDFLNNFALDLVNNNLFFFNTSGELYSINYLNQKINWMLNFKNPSLTGETELFLSQPIIIKNNNLIITTEKALLSYEKYNGARNWALSAESIFKPIITSKYTYAILKNDLLICLDNISGNVVWSKNIFSDIEKKKFKNKFGKIVDFKIVNSEINIYSVNGYLLTFNFNNGNLISKQKISKSGIGSEVVFLDDNMMFIDRRNKLLKFN